jgi:hypothetical protein
MFLRKLWRWFTYSTPLERIYLEPAETKLISHQLNFLNYMTETGDHHLEKWQLKALLGL